MKKLIKSPVINAICICLFTAFYWILFRPQSGAVNSEWIEFYYGNSSLWSLWSRLIHNGLLEIIANILLGVTILIIILLVLRRRSYDEYHTEKLTHCLVIAIVLTLIAIAVFYLVMLSEPLWITGKFTLFIVVHWATVVFSNLVYVLLCWRR